MDRHDYDPEHESRFSCETCQETGIDIESREYCTACELGKRRMNLDRLAEPLRLHPFSNAMWVVHHSAMKTERAIAAAEMALLKSKLLQKERELAEVRKKNTLYTWLANRVLACDYGDNKRGVIGWRITSSLCSSGEPFMYGESIDAAIAAASVAQANEEPKE